LERLASILMKSSIIVFEINLARVTNKTQGLKRLWFDSTPLPFN